MHIDTPSVNHANPAIYSFDQVHKKNHGHPKKTCCQRSFLLCPQIYHKMPRYVIQGEGKCIPMVRPVHSPRHVSNSSGHGSAWLTEQAVGYFVRQNTIALAHLGVQLHAHKKFISHLIISYCYLLLISAERNVVIKCLSRGPKRNIN